MQKIYITVTICFCLLLSLTPIATAESVKDCVDGNMNCPELDEDTQTNETPADDKQSGDAEADQTTGSLIWKLVQMVVALVFILVLIYGLLYLLNKRNKTFSKVQALENMGGISVGQNKSMQIVRIGEQFYVVGVGENVELLHEITDESLKREFNKTDKQLAPLPFSRFVSRFKNKSSAVPKSDFKPLFAKELEEMKQNRKQLIDQCKEERHE